ncbi:MAG: tetratricopeptide repeat protein [Thermoanaerobaculia bacterium]
MSSWASDSSGTRTFFDQGLFLLHLNRGKEEMRRGQYDSARREFEAAQQFRPHDPDVVSNLSFSLFHLGNYEDAERITRELLSSHPDSVPLLFNLGLILFKTERHAEAQEPLQRVLEIVPAHRKSHLTMGLIFQKGGNVSEAKRHFRLAGAELKEGSTADDTISRSARTAVASRKLTETAPIVKPEALEAPVEPAQPSENPIAAPSDTVEAKPVQAKQVEGKKVAAKPVAASTAEIPLPAPPPPEKSEGAPDARFKTGAVAALPKSSDGFQTGAISALAADVESTGVPPPKDNHATGAIPAVTQRLRARALAAKQVETGQIAALAPLVPPASDAEVVDDAVAVSPAAVPAAAVPPAVAAPAVSSKTPSSSAASPKQSAATAGKATPRAAPRAIASTRPSAAPADAISLSAPETFRTEAGGFLAASCHRGVWVRRGVLTGREGAPAFEVDRQLVGSLSQLLIHASGDGELLLVDRGRRPFLKSLASEFLSVEPGRLLAFESTLRFREDPAFEFRRHIAVPFLKLFGSGTVALSVASEPALFPVSVSRPLTLASRAVLAYGGDVVPDLLEESDPLASLGSGPVFRFVGTGYVLAEAG